MRFGKKHDHLGINMITKEIHDHIHTCASCNFRVLIAAARGTTAVITLEILAEAETSEKLVDLGAN